MEHLLDEEREWLDGLDNESLLEETLEFAALDDYYLVFAAETNRKFDLLQAELRRRLVRWLEGGE